MKHSNIYRDMCNRYGAHLPDRFNKLIEESNELCGAYKNFCANPTPENAAALLDELGDVSIIIAHICYIIGLPFDALMATTHAKIVKRDKNPAYKHEQKKQK